MFKLTYEKYCTILPPMESRSIDAINDLLDGVSPPSVHLLLFIVALALVELDLGIEAEKAEQSFQNLFECVLEEMRRQRCDLPWVMSEIKRLLEAGKENKLWRYREHERRRYPKRFIANGFRKLSLPLSHNS